MAEYKTANELTKFMLGYLDSIWFEVWRNNNLAVKGRAFIGRKGVPDIIGYHKKYGQYIGCEVKALGDKLSKEQVIFLDHLGVCGGASMLCYQTSDEALKLDIFVDGRNSTAIWNGKDFIKQ